jgi:hypothetical protein
MKTKVDSLHITAVRASSVEQVIDELAILYQVPKKTVASLGLELLNQVQPEISTKSQSMEGSTTPWQEQKTA